jgi:Acetyltransferase (isoleucine patch superfamily)
MKGVSFGSEPYLIEIKNEVTISFDVSFVTHDGGTWVFRDLDPSVNKFGTILVKERAFIGARSIILPNVIIGERSVIGAGSIVTKNVPDDEVWAGVPARFVMTREEYYLKLKSKAHEK